MAEYDDSIIILEGDEADWFMENALNPDREALRRRDAFFAEIDALGMVENNGVYTFEIPDIDLGESYCVEVDYSPIAQNSVNDDFHNWLDAIQLEIKSFNDMHERKIQVNYIEQSEPIYKRAVLKTLSICA
jgi:hypothetical protein